MAPPVFSGIRRLIVRLPVADEVEAKRERSSIGSPSTVRWRAISYVRSGILFHFKSILSRIVCLHVIAVAMTSAIMPAVLYWLLESETNNLHRESMRDNAETIAHHLVLRADGSWSLNLPASARDIYSRAYGRYAYAILDSGGNVLFSSLGSKEPLFPNETLQSRHGNLLLTGASVPTHIGDQTFWVQVGENLEHRDVIIDDIVADFFQRVGWVTIPILAILLAIDILIVRRALQPLVAASKQAQSISPKRADKRLASEGIPKEVTPLVLAVNQALGRLEQGLRVQREFTADAAHELRTPLAILRMRVDTLPDDTVRTELQRDIEGMCRVANQLLAMAELEAFALDPHEMTDLTIVCAEVTEALAPLALTQRKDLGLTGADGPMWVKGNQELIRTAIRNLVENAINHTPQDTEVRIEIARGGGVSVLDRGPGIPRSERELVFQRFWRRDRRRSGSAGLGLAIVRRIVEAHGATIAIEDRPSGGAKFSLRFMSADAKDLVGDGSDGPVTALARPFDSRRLRQNSAGIEVGASQSVN
jgi:signal transduction histidine kinase